MILSDGYGEVVTSDAGTFSQSGLSGRVVIQSLKLGYEFPQVEVSTADSISIIGRYTLQGRITDQLGQGISGAVISFSGGYPSVLTDSQGRWSQSDLSGTVHVSANKEGYAISPEEQKVSGPSEDLVFVTTYAVSGGD